MKTLFLTTGILFWAALTVACAAYLGYVIRLKIRRWIRLRKG